jgi:hypothetical protein
MDNDAPRPNTQTTTFVVGRLYIHAVSSATDIFEDWRLARPDLLAQVWPLHRNIVAWPPAAVLTDRDADQIASEFKLLSDQVGQAMLQDRWT